MRISYTLYSAQNQGFVTAGITCSGNPNATLQKVQNAIQALQKCEQEMQQRIKEVRS